MIEYFEPGEDLFKSKAMALVNAVNCFGAMGGGLAKAFKDRFPEMNADYEEFCKQKKLNFGVIHVYDHLRDMNPKNIEYMPRYTLNFPTKGMDLRASEISGVAVGLFELIKVIRDFHITSVAIPALGCGLGGLDWKDVKPIVVKAMEQLPDVRAMIYEPHVDPWLKKPYSLLSKKDNSKRGEEVAIAKEIIDRRKAVLRDLA